ncbi:phosphoribosyl transferase [Legionella quinlivanii]|uniref:Phosphoribosyl transferase n=1 Tax=Legionella quinlivanii TaxID=45073 RepID=A0A364LK73_9GAMM|nr:phosphoribosyltransferase [Legionella quinlivanii]RAP36990.1 phosphoribosyl transferase [Legionella quinlivanii]
MDKYTDRCQAGRLLATYLEKYKNSDGIVLGLPRGGVPVACEVAKKLHLPLDVLIVRKLGLPGYKELAMGAIASGGTVFFNEELIKNHNVSAQAIEAVIKAETHELLRREAVYRGKRPYPVLTGKKVILIDDGIATGATLKAAVEAIKKQNPSSITIAVPVADPMVCKELEKLVDEVVCPLMPPDIQAVGLWYDDFRQTSDQEVLSFLKPIF